MSDAEAILGLIADLRRGMERQAEMIAALKQQIRELEAAARDGD